MTWKKTWFSYFVWVCYTVMTVGLVVYLVGCQTGISEKYMQVAVGCIPFVTMLILFLAVRAVYRFTLPGRIPAGVWTAAEGLTVVGLLAAGVLLRMNAFPAQMPDNPFFELAKVQEGQNLEPMAHGALYYYILLLRGLFMILGNKWTAGLVLQILLQIVSVFLIYLAVRKIAGGLPAVWTFGFFMLAEGSIRASLAYSPENFYLVLYALGAFLLACYLDAAQRNNCRRWYCWIGLALLGIYISLLIYLDALALTLLVMAVGILGLKSREQEKDRTDRLGGIMLLFLLVVVIAGLLGFFLVDALVCGKGMDSVAGIWEWLFWPDGQVTVGLRQLCGWLNGDWMVGIVLIDGLILGVLGFWIKREQEKQSMWILLVIVSALFAYPCAASGNMSRLFPACLWIIVLAGVGVRSSLERKQTGELILQEEQPEEVQVHEEEETRIVEEETMIVEEATACPEQPKKEIQFIENPLPLPKKHIKKVMGYGREISPYQLKYDVEVSDDDDFDL